MPFFRQFGFGSPCIENDLKDLTLKCKNEPDKAKRRNVKLTMPVFYPCIDTTRRENKITNGVFQFDLDLEGLVS